jgi:hypothetical protein
MTVDISRTPSEKPPLTAANVNALAARILNHEPGTEEQATLLRSGWRNLLRQEFALEPIQQRNLAEIPADAIRQIQNALDHAFGARGGVRLELGNAQTGGHLTITPPTAPEAGMAVPHLNIGVLKCTFGADCSNWRCGPNLPR